MFRRGVIALLVILFPTAFATAQEFKSVRMGYPSLGFRQGHIWVAKEKDCLRGTGSMWNRFSFAADNWQSRPWPQAIRRS